MSAKSELLSKLEYLNDAISSPSLIDVGVLPSPHNAIAQLLRNGIGVIAFTILEDYIKKRAEEGLVFLSSSGIQFNNLTTKLQTLSTIDALKSMLYHLNFLKKSPGFDATSFVQTEAYNIYSTSVHPFVLSKYSLVYSQSNVLADEISDWLKSFGIDNCWPRLKGISDAIGGGIPDLASSFRNASQRRHSAAHDVSFNYLHGWLLNIKSEILAIAASIDIAVEAKCRQIVRDPTKRIDASDISSELNYRFIEIFSASLVKEKKSIAGKSIKNWPNLPAAIAALAPLLNTKKEFLVILNSSGRIVDWHT